MNREFREALRRIVSEAADFDFNVVSFDQITKSIAEHDSLSMSLTRSCLLIPDMMVSLKDACHNRQKNEIKSICAELKKELCNKHGIRDYPALWAINCWLFAFNAGMYYVDEDYLESVRRLDTNEREQLISLGDAYAVIIQNEGQADKNNAITKLNSLDHPAGLHYKARQITTGEPDEQGNTIALGLLIQAFNQGYKAVCIDLALLYSGEACGIAKDAEKMFFYAKEGAEEGNSRCMGIVALAYENGDGVEKDEAEALRYYKASAEKGNANAQAILGFAYSDGSMGCEKNNRIAYSWFKKSVDGGNYDLADKVGRALLTGEGLDKNVQEALRYLLLGAENGNTVAMMVLAEVYSTGVYMKEDYPKSAEWLKKAADAGDPFACHLLADYYREGIGVSKNLARADQYERKAVQLGYTEEDESEEEPEVVPDDVIEDLSSDVLEDVSEDMSDAEEEVGISISTIQQAAQGIATEATATKKSIPHNDKKGIDYILDDDTDDWDKIGEGDGITEIGNPKTRAYIAAIYDTWNHVMILAQDQGLDVCRQLARAYMFIITILAKRFSSYNIPNMGFFIANLYLGSKCRESLPGIDEYMDSEYHTYAQAFDELYKEVNPNWAQALLAILYRMNIDLGEYPESVATDLSTKQMFTINRLLMLKILD